LHQVHLELSDRLYKQAKRRAAEAGFGSVDEFVFEVLSEELSENLDLLFTPARLQTIDEAIAEVKAGRYLTAPETDVEPAKRRNQWPDRNGV
jgi:PHD/YefM family antitoxin component YafN of YafNO toxin-antitoxin module